MVIIILFSLCWNAFAAVESPTWQGVYLQEKLQPILDNKVLVYDPIAKEEKAFTVQKIVETLLQEMGAFALPYEAFFFGSAVANQCVAPINLECNDIDFSIVFISNAQKQDLDLFFAHMDMFMLSSLYRLLNIQQKTKEFFDVFHVKPSPIIQGVSPNYFTIYEFAPLEKVKLSEDLIIKRARSSYLPLQISVHFIPTKDKTDTKVWMKDMHIGSGDSFFIPLKLFDASLGSTKGGVYQLLSMQGDVGKVIADVEKKLFIGNLYRSGVWEWARFLIKITEGFYDPSIEANCFFYKINARSQTNSIEKLETFIRKKRNIVDYPLFFLLNAMFHLPNEGEEKEKFAKRVIEIIQEKKSLQKANHAVVELLALLSKQLPATHFPTLCKVVLPVFAEEVCIKTHLQKVQMQCRFIREGNPLVVYVPLLEESDNCFLVDILQHLSLVKNVFPSHKQVEGDIPNSLSLIYFAFFEQCQENLKLAWKNRFPCLDQGYQEYRGRKNIHSSPFKAF